MLNNNIHSIITPFQLPATEQEYHKKFNELFSKTAEISQIIKNQRFVSDKEGEFLADFLTYGKENNWISPTDLQKINRAVEGTGLLPSKTTPSSRLTEVVKELAAKALEAPENPRNLKSKRFKIITSISSFFSSFVKNLNIRIQQQLLFHEIANGDIDRVKERIEKKEVDLNTLTKNGMALHIAAKNDKAEICELLVQKGIDLESKDSQGKTALYYAIKKNKREAYKCLIILGASVEPELLNTWQLASNLNLLDKAKKNNNAIEFLSQPAAKGPLYYTTLFHLLAPNNVKLFTHLMETHAINLKDAAGFTPLHCAILEQNTEIIKLLIDAGADVKQTDEDGKPPLYLALWKADPAILQLLVKAGADVNQADKDGKSILCHTINSCNIKVTSLLIDSGADVNQTDKDGKSILYHAIISKNTKIIELLINSGADVNQTDKDGKSILCHIVNSGNIEATKLLIDLGADVNQTDKDKKPPLYHAIISKNTKIIEFLIKVGGHINQEAISVDDLAIIRSQLNVIRSQLNVSKIIKASAKEYEARKLISHAFKLDGKSILSLDEKAILSLDGNVKKAILEFISAHEDVIIKSPFFENLKRQISQQSPDSSSEKTPSSVQNSSLSILQRTYQSLKKYSPFFYVNEIEKMVLNQQQDALALYFKNNPNSFFENTDLLKLYLESGLLKMDDFLEILNSVAKDMIDSQTDEFTGAEPFARVYAPSIFRLFKEELIEASNSDNTRLTDLAPILLKQDLSSSNPCTEEEFLEISEMGPSLMKEKLEKWSSSQPRNGKISIAKDLILSAYLNKSPGLDLSELELENLPDFIGDLKELKILDLSKNQLTQLPDSFGNLNLLTHLSLYENQLTQLPDSFGNLNLLTHLNLSENQLTQLPDSFGNLNLLTHLSLFKNQLTQLPDSFGNLNLLTHLSLYENQLTQLPDSFGNLNLLTDLNLSENQLTQLPDSFGSLMEVEIINLDNNTSLSSLPMNLGQILNLTILSYEGTNIPANDVETILAQCENLRKKESKDFFPLRLNKWETLGNQPALDFSFFNSFEEKETASINEWLLRLERTADFNEKQQQDLAAIVCKILMSLRDNQEFKEIFLTQIEANNESCQDRAAMALNEIYTSWKIYNLPENTPIPEKLEIMKKISKTLALRAFIAQSITAYEKTENSPLPESVEIYLAFETGLKNSLGLDSVSQSMSYKSIGEVSWINVEDLTEYVQKNFLDHLIQLESFKKILSNDTDFQNSLEIINNSFFVKLEPLNAKLRDLESELQHIKAEKKQKKDEEAKDHQILEVQSELGTLYTQYQSENNDLAKAWYHKKMA